MVGQHVPCPMSDLWLRLTTSECLGKVYLTVHGDGEFKSRLWNSSLMNIHWADICASTGITLGMLCIHVTSTCMGFAEHACVTVEKLSIALVERYLAQGFQTSSQRQGGALSFGNLTASHLICIKAHQKAGEIST
ncbi:unnamed protein product [Fusarium graminearum]|uniref:Chromosome 1, complete genome n=1 Tax=Gibberella zeae (strain ATCC MYA-4620 / CBS 123657 / FGSC 9075 / NRRL 31084 / PH-1) TaxID=229533 RepID=A0A0E0RQ92_GIBZE|nr:hypothetical protein FG05_35026 [Fusarium graminearum]CEF73417.1 unnamed protein product [Fusarium graminearum]